MIQKQITLWYCFVAKVKDNFHEKNTLFLCLFNGQFSLYHVFLRNEPEFREILRFVIFEKGYF